MTLHLEQTHKQGYHDGMSEETGRPTTYRPEMVWPADKPERRKVADLTPYARNSRTHSDEQVAQIAASIKEWGFTTPILIDPEGGIIAGHGRVMAAQRQGSTDPHAPNSADVA